MAEPNTVEIEKKVLERLDTKSFGFFHVKMIIISGMGFFTDSYDLFSISLLTRLLGRIYFTDNPYYINYSTIGGTQYGVQTVSPGKLPINYDCAISAVALCGTLAGQFLFGRLGDLLGRRSCYGLALAIMIVCAFGQSMTFGTTAKAMVGTLCFWRFVLGVGVGGDYPLSATIMSEYSSTISRGAYIGSVFAMQGFGILIAAAITAIITAIFEAAHHNNSYPNTIYGTDGSAFYWTSASKTKGYDFLTIASRASDGTTCTNIDAPSGPSKCTSYNTHPAADQTHYITQISKSCPPENDFVWRIVLCFGALPAALTMYFRLHMAETPRFTLHVEKDVTKFNNDMVKMINSADDNAGLEEVSEEHIIKKNATGTEDVPFGTFMSKYGLQLLGTAMTWCLLDVAFYSQNLFQKDVFLQIGWLPPAARMSALRETAQISKCQALIALGSTIPGYWATVFTVDFLGRRNIQFMGFIFMTGFMAALAGGYKKLLNPNTPKDRALSSDRDDRRHGWIAMYAFCFFFANFGPNSTTFIVPAELFPTKWKATGHGISAGCGKAGAILGAFGFLFAATPAKKEITWSFPCTYVTDLYTGPDKYGCVRKNNCPTGRMAPKYNFNPAGVTSNGLAIGTYSSSALPYTECSLCIKRVLSGCYPFGLGVAAALAILAATNFLGMLFTFFIPETMGKSLEELNGEVSEGDKVDEDKAANQELAIVGVSRA